MRISEFLRKGAIRSHSLTTTILASVGMVVLVIATCYVTWSYQRLSSQTLEAAGQWSESVAKLVASNTTSDLILNDVAAIESNLRQVVQLPGIIRIALFRADGRKLVDVRIDQGNITSDIGGSVRMPSQAFNAQSIPNRVNGGTFESWAAIDPGTVHSRGWVRVWFSLEQRTKELNTLWRQSLFGTLGLVALLLVSLYFITRWALRPIRELSRFADEMPTNIGSQINIGSTFDEANHLALALNHASQTIAEQVSRVQAIVNTATDAIIGLDINGLVVTSNPVAASIFGRPMSELAGNPVSHCVPELTLENIRQWFEDSRGYSGGANRVIRHDLFGRRADGTRFPVEISLGEIPDNQSLSYACSVRDVTDARAAQDAADLYERALACSHNAVFITNARNPKQPIVYVNDAFVTVTGLKRFEIMGSGMDFLRGADPNSVPVMELEKAVKSQSSASVTVSHVLEGGRRLEAEVSLSPVLSDQGVVTNFVGIISDVTSRVEAEEATAERKAQLDSIFGLSPDGFVMFDASDRLIFCNPAFEQMTGTTWMNPSAPLTFEDFESAIRHLCAPDHTPYVLRATTEINSEASRTRLHLIRPQHRVLQVQFRRNDTGRNETIMYFRDITHEDEVDRMKSEFLTSAAHELRTPMVSIFGFTELLLKRKFAEARQTDILETIHRQSGLLVKMINELLDLARIESRGGLDLQIAAHPLTELVVNCVKGLMRNDTERQVVVSGVPDVQVLIDPEKIQLALNNLLSNAFKYSPDGGEVSLTVRLKQAGNQEFAVLEVRDDGIGMTPEQTARAFERFYRADATGNIPGTGLGLSLVKEIAELHHGRVELQSTLGQGTIAQLWLPRAIDFTPSGRLALSQFAS